VDPKTLKCLLIPEEALEQVRTLLSLEKDQLVSLEQALGDRQAIKGDKRIYRTIAERLVVSPDVALGILSAVRNLRDQRERFDINDDVLIEDLKVLNNGKLGASDVLLKLLRQSEDDYFVEKVSSLRNAVVPHVTSVRTVVDGRPVFSKNRERIEGMLLVTYLELRTHDARNNDAKAIVLQVSRKQIQKLRASLDDAEKKLDRLAETMGGLDVYE
jgi:hypothetical protein